MITTVRRFAAPLSLTVLMLFVAGPGLVWAEPPPVPGAAGAALPSEAAPSPRVTSSRTLAALAGTPADLAPALDNRLLGQSPQSLETTPPSTGGSWWSRRSTAQKTWFIVGLVVGAYGIYAVATNGSKSHSGSGGGGGGGGGY